MISKIEQIEFEMLSEYERAGTLDVAEWTRRYPDHRNEILDFWVWLKGTPRLEDFGTAPESQVRDRIGEDALEQATLAVTLGRQWLEDAVEDEAEEEEHLGRELEGIRHKPFQQRGKASVSFRRAAVSAWVVSMLAQSRQRVSRLALQKSTYFLEHSLNLGLFTKHKKKPLGPYDHAARYKDAEPIAKDRGWLVVRGSTIYPGKAIEEAGRYAPRYLREQDLARRILNVLQGLTDAELEAWATVHSAACGLQHDRQEVSIESIRALLGRTAEWRGKLARSNFSDEGIRSALVHLARLRLLNL